MIWGDVFLFFHFLELSGYYYPAGTLGYIYNLESTREARLVRVLPIAWYSIAILDLKEVVDLRSY